MQQYQQLLQRILALGEARTDRTGVGTLSLFGEQLRFDLRAGFPLSTTKKMFWKGLVHELLWFLHPTDNLDYLHQQGVHIWDQWGKPHHLHRERLLVGPIYGMQWRQWQGLPEGSRPIDQLGRVIEQLKTDPYSRRHFVSAWNVAELDEMALPPCHVSFQFYVAFDGGLSCHLYQRSADAFLGLPFNIASYALLTHLVAQVTGLYPEKLIISFGDVHLYQNHVSQAREVLSRPPYPLPSLALSPNIKDIDSFCFEDLTLIGYRSHPTIPAPIAV